MIRVAGDSMAPTLGDGDDILVDRGDGAERLRDGIYVLRLDGALVVKRLVLAADAAAVDDPQRQSRLARSAAPRRRPRSTWSAGWSGPAGASPEQQRLHFALFRLHPPPRECAMNATNQLAAPASGTACRDRLFRVGKKLRHRVSALVARSSKVGDRAAL